MRLKRILHYNFGLLRGILLKLRRGIEGGKLVVHPRALVHLDEGARLVVKGRLIFGYSIVGTLNRKYRHAGQLAVGKNARVTISGNAEFWPGVKVIVKNGSELTVGDRVFFAGDSTIVVNHGLRIGSECAISWGVEIMDSDMHDLLDANAGVVNPGGPITIGDKVWLCQGVKILKGVSIGNNCVVGAGAVVTSSFEANSVIAGNPARRVRKLEGTWSYIPTNVPAEAFLW